MKLKYALKKKTKFHNEPTGSFENPISHRRPGRPRIYKNSNITRKTSLEIKANEVTNQRLPHEINVKNEEQQWIHSENNICKKIEFINFRRESNTSSDSLNLIIDEERNITHEENFSTSSQSLIDNEVDTSFKNNQFNIGQDTVSTNAFNFKQPSTSLSIRL